MHTAREQPTLVLKMKQADGPFPLHNTNGAQCKRNFKLKFHLTATSKNCSRGTFAILSTHVCTRRTGTSKKLPNIFLRDKLGEGLHEAARISS